MNNNPSLGELLKQAEAKAQTNAKIQPVSSQQQPIQVQSRILKHSLEPDLRSRIVLEHTTICSEAMPTKVKPSDSEDK